MFVDLPRVILRRSRSMVHWFDAAVSFLARFMIFFFSRIYNFPCDVARRSRRPAAGQRELDDLVCIIVIRIMTLQFMVYTDEALKFRRMFSSPCVILYHCTRWREAWREPSPAVNLVFEFSREAARGAGSCASQW